MSRRIKSLFKFGLLNGEIIRPQSARQVNGKAKIMEVLFGLEIVEEIFFKPSTNMSSNHCVPDSEHISTMILGLPWSQSDNNNSGIFVRLLSTNPKSPALLNATRNITDGSM